VLLAAVVVVIVMMGGGRKPGAPAPEGTAERGAAVPEPPVAPPPATPSPETTATSTAGSPFDEARALYDAGKYAPASLALRKLINTGALDRATARQARELRARALVHLGRAADAQKVYADLLAQFPGFTPDPAGLTDADRAAFDAAKAGPARETTAVATPPAGGPVTLVISANPYAESFMVDGDSKGANLKQVRVQLRAGHHAIKVTHPTLGAHEWSVDLEAGATRELSWDFLASSSGSISVSATGGWGEIYLDGDAIHHPTPYLITGVLPGKHEVSLVREGFSVEGGAQTVVVKSGQQASVSFKLKARK
jgi:hypothetical protein